MSKEAVRIFDNKYTGEDISSKLKRVREQMAQKGATLPSDVITLRYRLAFKCQGRRHKLCACSAFIPGTVTGQLHMVLQEEVVTETLKAYLDKNGIQTRPYDDFL